MDVMPFFSNKRRSFLTLGVVAVVVALVIVVAGLFMNMSGHEQFDRGTVGDVTFPDVRGTFVEQAASMASKSELWSDTEGERTDVLGDAHAVVPSSTKPLTLESAGVNLSDIESDGYGKLDMDSPIPVDGSVICKVTWVDGNVLSRDYNLDAWCAENNVGVTDRVILGQTVSMAEAFETESSDYVAVWLTPNAQVNGSEVIQVVFTEPNNDGHVLEGCVYDWDTGIALIPKKAFLDNEHLVQAQVYVACSISEDIAMQSVDVSVADASHVPGVKVGTAKQDFRVIETGMDVAIAEPGTKISDDVIEVRLNGSLSKFTQKSYDEATGCVRLAITPERVSHVDVLVHSSEGKAYAGTAANMDFARSKSGKRMRMPDDGTLQVGEYTTFITDFWMIHPVGMAANDYNSANYAAFNNWESNLYVPLNHGSWTDNAYYDDPDPNAPTGNTGYWFSTSYYQPYILGMIADGSLDSGADPHFDEHVRIGSGSNLHTGQIQGENEDVIVKSNQIIRNIGGGQAYVPVAFAARCYYPAGYSTGEELRRKCLMNIPGGQFYDDPYVPADRNRMVLGLEGMTPAYKQVGDKVMRHLAIAEKAVVEMQGLEWGGGVQTPLSIGLNKMSENILADHGGDLNALNLSLMCCHTQTPIYSAMDYFPYVDSGKYGGLSARVLAIDRDAADPYAIIGFVSTSIGTNVMSDPTQPQGLQAGCGIYKVSLEPETGSVKIVKDARNVDGEALSRQNGDSFSFTAQFSKNGHSWTENFSLNSRNGWTKQFDKIEKDTVVTVSEAANDLYDASWNPASRQVTVQSGETVTVTATNTRKTGRLNIVKQVANNVGANNAFKFNVRVYRDWNETDLYKTFSNVSVSQSGGAVDLGENIPSGYWYVVDELPDPHFEIESVTPRKGSIVAGRTVTVDAKNVAHGYVKVTKRVIGPDRDHAFTFRLTVTKPDGSVFSNKVFQLKADQTSEVFEYPAGYKYTVTEDTEQHFRLKSFEGLSGTIESGVTKEGVATNMQNGFATMEKQVTM